MFRHRLSSWIKRNIKLFVIIVDLNSTENDVMIIMAINSNTGSLELIPVDTGEEAAVEFHKIDYEIFIRKLADAL